MAVQQEKDLMEAASISEHFCYAFENFCTLGNTPDFLTCTDILQSWNQPRGPKVDPVPVEMLSKRKNEILNKTNKSSVVFDPRPKQFQKCNPNAVEKFRCNLLNKCDKGNAAFLTILVPSLAPIAHDHTYASKSKGAEDLTTNETAECEENEDDEEKECDNTSDRYFLAIGVQKVTTVIKLCLSSKQREDMERATRMQSAEELWYDARRYRITGSKCGRILTQKKRTVALLHFALYPKPFETTPKPIEWGRRNENLAREVYIAHMKAHGHPRIQAEVCGLFVHPVKGWLAASPDARVNDPDAPLPFGIAEIKCPFSKADVTVEVACKDTLFYCTMDREKNLKLARNHQYYHQVQLQLYTSGASWCDFCVYTTKDIAIERIYPDNHWQQAEVPKLDSYFHEQMLPEIVSPQVKPRYYL